MANTSLPNLTERTATANTDLIHVNSGGTDYKQTKENFLQGDLYHAFDNTSLLTAQIDALPSNGTFFGHIASYGAQSVTGVPVNSHGDVFVQKFNGNYVVVDFHPIGYSDATYRKCKNSGTWDSSWTQLPSRSEINSLNKSLANTLGKYNPYNIASFSEFDAIATSGGFYTFRTSASFACGNGTMPNYGRGLIMNYPDSTDSSFILCSPTGFVYGFKNSGKWKLKQLSF